MRVKMREVKGAKELVKDSREREKEKETDREVGGGRCSLLMACVCDWLSSKRPLMIGSVSREA